MFACAVHCSVLCAVLCCAVCCIVLCCVGCAVFCCAIQCCGDATTRLSAAAAESVCCCCCFSNRNRIIFHSQASVFAKYICPNVIKNIFEQIELQKDFILTISSSRESAAFQTLTERLLFIEIWAHPYSQSCTHQDEFDQTPNLLICTYFKTIVLVLCKCFSLSHTHQKFCQYLLKTCKSSTIYLYLLPRKKVFFSFFLQNPCRIN